MVEIEVVVKDDNVFVTENITSHINVAENYKSQHEDGLISDYEYRTKTKLVLESLMNVVDHSVKCIENLTNKG